MTDQTPIPAERKNYSSPTIIARRRQILDETRKLVAEQGITGFSMDELGRRAGVAKRTLYNSFQSKERLIATAIQQYFADFVERFHIEGQAGTLPNLIDQIAAIARRGVRLKNYNRALMSIYHSAEVDPEIWAAIHDIGADLFRPYVESLAARRQLQAWISPERLIDGLVRFRYASGNDYCNGRIADNDYVERLLIGILMFLASATRGASRREIEAALAATAAGATADG